MDAVYRALHLNYYYRLGTQRVEALRDLTLEIERGGLYCLSGPSGSGKTTLLNLLGLISKVQEGELIYKDRHLEHLREAPKDRIRRFEIGFIFQVFNLFPVLSAQENVEYFVQRQGVGRKERRRRAQQALEDVGLWDYRARKPFELSGGQRQRVAIARALAKRPEVIIGDEPTANLDQKTGRAIMETLNELNDRYGVTFVLSSHDPMVQDACPRRIRLQDGSLV